MQESAVEWAAKQPPPQETNDTFLRFLLVVFGITGIFLILVWWFVTSEDGDEELEDEDQEDEPDQD